jgi:hypothetical protein
MPTKMSPEASQAFIVSGPRALKKVAMQEFAREWKQFNDRFKDMPAMFLVRLYLGFLAWIISRPTILNWLSKPTEYEIRLWRDQRSRTWNSLEKGMPKDLVRKILGEPSSIATADQQTESWFYPETGESVTFDEDSLVSSWEKT